MDSPDRDLGGVGSMETMGRFPFAFADLDGVEWTLDTGLWSASGVVGRCGGSVTAGMFTLTPSEMIIGRYRLKQFAQ